MGVVTPFPNAAPDQVVFVRLELQRILDLYGRMVAAGNWRDYAIHFGRDVATFSCFRRATERPEYRIEKRPALRQRQGEWALISEAGAVCATSPHSPASAAPRSAPNIASRNAPRCANGRANGR
jgi:hypothetical protein